MHIGIGVGIVMLIWHINWPNSARRIYIGVIGFHPKSDYKIIDPQ